MTTTSSGTTSKWIKGLIMLLGAAIIPVIITFFANGGHPTADNWLTVIKTAAGIFIMYMIKPAQTNQDPFGSVNWADFLHGIATVAGGFVVGTVIPALIHWPLATTGLVDYYWRSCFGLWHLYLKSSLHQLPGNSFCEYSIFKVK